MSEPDSLSSTSISVVVVVVSVIVSLATQVLEKLGLLILSISQNLSTGKAELKDYSHNVKALKRRLKEWEQNLKNRGVSDLPALASRLKVAEMLLADVENRAKDLEKSLFRRCTRGVASLAFPKELSLSIQRVHNAIGDIKTALSDIDDENTGIQKVLGWEPRKLSFSVDKYYIPNANALNAVKKALEESTDRPGVVVLYGEPGSGKTHLAKHLGLEYERIQVEKERESIRLENENKEQPADYKPPVFPDGVFFVDCGPGVEITSCYEALLSDLGLAGPKEASAGEEGTGSSGPSPSKGMLKSQLQRGLSERSALIIVDNVCETSVLNALVVVGAKRKYLVTTQNANCALAWGDLIKLQKLDHKAARELLLKRVFPGQDASAMEGHLTALESYIDEMINVTNGNPQALACLAEFLKNRPKDETRWREVLDLELLSALDDQYTSTRLGHSSTVFSSMMMSLDALHEKEPLASKLLLFLTLCKTRVPEAVIRTVYCFLNQSRQFLFTLWLDRLEKWSLIEQDLLKVSWSEDVQKLFSVPSLRRLVILEEKAEDLSSLIKTELLNTEYSSVGAACPSEGGLVAALCAVYGDETVDFLKQELRLLGLDVDGSEEYETRRKFVMEAVSLLHSGLEGGRPKSIGHWRKGSIEKWKLKSHNHGKKVIVQVLSEGNIDNEDIAGLLALPHPTPSIICQALKVLLASEQPNHGFGRIMRGLSPVTLLANMDTTLTQQRALEVVLEYSGKAKVREEELVTFMSIEGTVDALSKLLNNSVQQQIRSTSFCVKNNLSGLERKVRPAAQLNYSLKNLIDCKEVDLAVRQASTNVESKLKLNGPEESKLPLDELEALLRNLDEILDNAVEEVFKIRRTSAYILENLLAAENNKNTIATFSNIQADLETLAKDEETAIGRGLLTVDSEDSNYVGHAEKALQILLTVPLTSAASTSSSL